MNTNLLNIDKVTIIAKRIKDFQKCLHTGYPFVEQTELRDAIIKAEVWDENDVWRLSKLREDKKQKLDELKYSTYDSKSFEKISRSILKGNFMQNFCCSLN